MKLNKKGLDFISLLEGVKLKRYKDTKGIWTIGIGSTYLENGDPVTNKTKDLNLSQVYSLFEITSKSYENAVNNFVKVPITQNQFNALFALCYNIGVKGFRTSTVLKRINSKDTNVKIAEAWMRWTKQKELIGRRKKEINLYFTQ